MDRKPIGTAQLRKMNKESIPISVITAYDYPSACLAEEAGADCILVGDSLGNVVLGLDSTLPVTLEDMIHHTKMVARAAKTCFVIADMPFLTYHGSLDRTLDNAGRLLQEGMAKAVKLEGGREITDKVAALTQAGIPVMGHLGFTPQSVHQFGGYFVQGRSEAKRQKMLADAKALEQAGAFAIVLEMVPEPLAKEITDALSVPTIGIGAGRYCAGQVLVYHDLLQYGPSAPKKFVKTYADLNHVILNGIREYISDVKTRRFPEEAHAFDADKQDTEPLEHLYGKG